MKRKDENLMNGEIMNNTDRLIKISNALAFETLDIVEMFELSDVEISEEAVEHIFKDNGEKQIQYEMLEAFLNGIIVFNRGERKLKPGEEKRKPMEIADPRSTNNIVLKKLKIAFSLSSEDMLNLIQSGGVVVSKDKLSALFRKEGHKSYKYCKDIYVEGLLKALSEKTLI